MLVLFWITNNEQCLETSSLLKFCLFF